ncbi:MAG: hypothetical protein NTW58_08165 [Actinobacteria bacterium]|nr:hypothetical protein [Actinomycetota bacterium]
MRVGVRGEHESPGGDRAFGREQPEAVGGGAEGRRRGHCQHRRILEDAGAEPQGQALLLAHELGGVDQQQARLPEGAEVARRRDHGLRLVGADPRDAVETQRLHELDLPLQAFHVARGGRHAQETRADLVAVELLVVDEALELVDAALHVGVRAGEELLAAHERCRAQSQADHRHRKGAVTAAGPVGGGLGLDDGDAGRGLGAAQLTGGGETGQATADDRDVHVQVAAQGSFRINGVALVEPQR